MSTSTALVTWALCLLIVGVAASATAHTLGREVPSDLRMLREAPTVAAVRYSGERADFEEERDLTMTDGTRHLVTRYETVLTFEVVEVLHGDAVARTVDVHYIGYGEPLEFDAPVPGQRVVVGLQARREGPGFIASYQRFMQAESDERLDAIRTYAAALREEAADAAARRRLELEMQPADTVHGGPDDLRAAENVNAIVEETAVLETRVEYDPAAAPRNAVAFEEASAERLAPARSLGALVRVDDSPAGSAEAGVRDVPAVADRRASATASPAVGPASDAAAWLWWGGFGLCAVVGIALREAASRRARRRRAPRRLHSR